MEDAGWRHAPNQSAQDQITEMRTAIDELDQAIAALLAQRLSLSSKIGAVKASSAIAIKDDGRENVVLQNVRSVVDNDDVAQALGNIYASVLNESRVLQQRLSTDAEPKTASTSTEVSTVYFPRVLIIGMGMIGGSMARQIKNKMRNAVVCGVDHPGVLERALNEGIIDESSADLSKSVARAGLILLCASPDENLRLLKQIAPFTKRRQIIMDVTSTKQEICELAESTPMKADFVGGHPLFGSHKSGLDAARDVSVDGKRFCIVPTSRSSELTLRRLARWLTDLGMKVVQADAHQHDAALARTSHVVQLLSVSLGNALSRNRTQDDLRNMLALSGTSLSSLTRLMSSPADMWLDITRQNKDEIQSALTELIEELKSTRSDIALDDQASLRARFTQAARITKLHP